MFEGILVLCIAGTTLTDLPGTTCIKYKSPPFEKLVRCEAALKSVLKSDEIDAMTKMPEYDLEVVSVSCRKVNNEKKETKNQK